MTSCPHSGIEARGGLLSCWEENEEELLRYLISMLAQFLRVQVCPVDLMERERERDGARVVISDHHPQGHLWDC